MQPFTPIYSPFANDLIVTFLPLIIVGVLWTISIKGYALWTAARAEQRNWFIALLILNTLGILEIVYLIWFRKIPSHKPTPAVSSSPRA